MKYGALLLAAVQGNVLQNAGIAEGSKRYNQLVSMMENFNPSFDEKKYWSYGCNCLVIGDRPMSDPGRGKPVDAMDTTCKRYKDCLKCARMNHGEACIGEFQQYGMRITKAGNVICKDDAGSCNRALCECDAMFAQEHVQTIDSYNEDYNLFYSQIGWDPEDQCITNPGPGSDPKCCGAADSVYVLYNANNKKCCSDGTVKTDCGEGPGAYA